MFCVITPIFDDAVEAAKLLTQDLQNQTYKDFTHVLISNGPIKQTLKIQDKRFVYEQYPFEKLNGLFELIANLGKRRNYCLKKFVADRYFFFDADLKVTDNDFFAKIKVIHDKADVIISKTIHKRRILPIPPYVNGTIDIANYSFTRNIVDKYDYPTDCEGHIANDWRFYSRIKDESHFDSNVVYAIKDGRPMYRNLTSLASLNYGSRKK